MIAIIHMIWISGGEQAVIFSNWALFAATTFDAKVGIRIYTRATILINLLTGKVTKHHPVIEPAALTKVHTAKTLNAAPDRYIRA